MIDSVDFLEHATDDLTPRRFYSIPIEFIHNDSFLQSSLHKKSIQKNPTMSPWLIQEIRSLTALSTRLQREMAINILVNTEGDFFLSEVIILGDKNRMNDGSINIDGAIPQNFRIISTIHTHPHDKNASAGFSAGFLTDWTEIIHGKNNFLHIVGTASENIYIAHRPSGRLQNVITAFEAKKNLKTENKSAKERLARFYDSLYEDHGILSHDDYHTLAKNDNNDRIATNIRLAELFGFDLFQINMKTGSAVKLVRPLE